MLVSQPPFSGYASKLDVLQRDGTTLSAATSLVSLATLQLKTLIDFWV